MVTVSKNQCFGVDAFVIPNINTRLSQDSYFIAIAFTTVHTMCMVHKGCGGKTTGFFHSVMLTRGDIIWYQT